MHYRQICQQTTAALLIVCAVTTCRAVADDSLEKLVADTQAKVVKIFGAGGLAGLEGYQSGFLISPSGHVATAWSYVLDAEPLVVLNDGRRFTAEVIGIDPQLELAVLKIPADDLPYFELNPVASLPVGEPVLAFSNLFGIAAGSEPVSVLHGHILGVTRLDARRGNQASTYRGDVYLLDLIANNPGAAGGALINWRGELLGILGKELRDNRTGTWQNYALPISQLRPALQRMLSGGSDSEATSTRPSAQPWTLELLGLGLVPDLLDKTPNYVDHVTPDGPAARSGLLPDDLLLMVNGQRLDSQTTLRELLVNADRRDPLSLLIQRGSEIISLTIRPE